MRGSVRWRGEKGRGVRHWSQSVLQLPHISHTYIHTNTNKLVEDKYMTYSLPHVLLYQHYLPKLVLMLVVGGIYHQNLVDRGQSSGQMARKF